MPAVPRCRPLLVLALLLAVPGASLAMPSVGGVVHGAGTVSAFTVYRDSGEAFEGGLHRRNLACLDCTIRLTLTTGTVTVVQDGAAFDLTPGTWEVREFRGYFGYTPRGLGHVDFRIEGDGIVGQVA